MSDNKPENSESQAESPQKSETTASQQESPQELDIQIPAQPDFFVKSHADVLKKKNEEG